MNERHIPVDAMTIALEESNTFVYMKLKKTYVNTKNFFISFLNIVETRLYASTEGTTAANCLLDGSEYQHRNHDRLC